MSDKKIHLVISRFNEDISWIREVVNEKIMIYLYNKGEEIKQIFPNYAKIINLDNIGREAHTYLHHIVSNYEVLPEKIIFSQAHPDDHVDENFKSNFLDFLNSSDEFRYFSKNILEMRVNHDGVEESGILNGSFWSNKHSLESCCVTVPFELIPQIELKKWIFGTGAIFGVSSGLILKNSKEFYKRCLDILEESLDPIKSPEAHAFERSWYLIFN